jgi:DNA-binding response OmpR family regulator
VDTGLHILLADPDPEQSAMLGRYLVDQGHRVQTTVRGSEIQPSLKRQVGEQRPIELLILGRDLRGMDGIQVLDHIRGIHPAPAIIFVEPLEGLDPAATSFVRSLGVRRILASPIDLGRLQHLIDELRGSRATDDVPFFGTTRMVRRSQSSADLEAPPPTEAVPGRKETTGLVKPAHSPFDEADAEHERRSSQHDLSLQLSPDHPDEPAVSPASSSYGRKPTGIYSTSYRRRRTTGTVRRSITGRIERGTQATTAGTMAVRCAHCSQQFSVPRRQEEFNVMCIHCSKLNRIPAAIVPPRDGGD